VFEVHGLKGGRDGGSGFSDRPEAPAELSPLWTLWCSPAPSQEAIQSGLEDVKRWQILSSPGEFVLVLNHLAIQNVSFTPRLHASGSRSQPSAVAPRAREGEGFSSLETRRPLPASPPEHRGLPNRLSPLCQANHPQKNPFLPRWNGQVALPAPGRPWDRMRSSWVRWPAERLLNLQINLENCWAGGYSPRQALLGRKFGCFSTGETEDPRRWALVGMQRSPVVHPWLTPEHAIPHRERAPTPLPVPLPRRQRAREGPGSPQVPPPNGSTFVSSFAFGSWTVPGPPPVPLWGDPWLWGWAWGLDCGGRGGWNARAGALDRRVGKRRRDFGRWIGFASPGAPGSGWGRGARERSSGRLWAPRGGSVGGRTAPGCGAGCRRGGEVMPAMGFGL